ncbi:MAG: hypothetical protein FP813_12010 [Desulfurivibrio sp.]|nr:hypothetical protein [Desulfurivibrio sp.]MBU4118294.1 hypothetical protein [Pseudomonadota bacterium]
MQVSSVHAEPFDQAQQSSAEAQQSLLQKLHKKPSVRPEPVEGLLFQIHHTLMASKKSSQ